MQARWPAVVALAVLLTVAGTLAGWRLAGEVRQETEVGRVSLAVSPSLEGEVEAFVPLADWGLRAHAFQAPLSLRAELRSVNRNVVLAAAEGDREVLDRTEGQLRDGAVRALLVAQGCALAAILVLLGAATAMWRGLRPRWALIGVGGGIALASSFGLLWRVEATFDPAAFRSPTYFARGQEIARILEVAENERVRTGYGSEFASIVRSVSTVLSDEPIENLGGPDLYMGSDLHGNVLVVDPVARIVGEKPLLLVGDFGQRATPAEVSFLAPRSASMSPSTYAVSGNHDTAALMRRLAEEGVTVLAQEGRLRPGRGFVPPPVVEAHGLRIAGYGDPLEYEGGDPASEGRIVGLDQLPEEEADRRVEEWSGDLLAWFRGLRRKPDLLMLHQDRLGQRLAASLWGSGYRRPLTIATGDDHRQHVDRYGRVVVVDSGTLGAGGIFEAGTQTVGLGHLHFARTGGLRSVDLIAVEPFSGEARANRIVIDTMCEPGEERCSVSSDELEEGPVE